MSAATREPWYAPRWQSTDDPPAWASHNARLRYEARRTEIGKTLAAAIDAAARDFAEMGLNGDEAGEWIYGAPEMSNWADYFDEES